MSILSFVRQLVYFITSFSSCQELFSFSFFQVFDVLCCFSQQMICYHIFSCLSTSFLISFLLLFCRLSLARSSNVDYFTTVFILCQQLFSFFYIHYLAFLNRLILSNKITEKEGFEPSRRANDLHP